MNKPNEEHNPKEREQELDKELEEFSGRVRTSIPWAEEEDEDIYDAILAEVEQMQARWAQ
jgi:hypothetical protein